MKVSLKAGCMVVAGLVSAGAQATEGGGSIYPVGSENYTCCALPPPGLYGMAYAQHYRATTLRDNQGNRVPVPGFEVEATALVPRLVWVTPTQVAGASLAYHAILPVVDLKVSAAGQSQGKTGLGDAVVGAALGWHHSPQLHTLLGLDVFLPTGDYDKANLANIGRNYWAFQPVVGVSYIDPAGLNADAKVMYTVNQKNSATDYRSGQELIIDYSLGWGFNNGWVAGVGGYVYQQTTDDRQAGATVPGNKGRALAIGPSIRYQSQKGWFAMLKYQKETRVRNRAEGDALWLKVVVPF
ncbi:MAG: SphA family protein [Burkholderiales bacterium]